ncbi:hypothetical protein [Litorihabitans aurantiacus]|uniref:DoxX family membrane protein n=1 Tax=Litorihabitans aurantiacus TaxID=1930061 RepID=A0AA37XGN0_9MICO|nr:hypothetical protein [Litorihabitans aurantiacus]GMA32927.1 hypothetical protein GCM10025875_29190 [Litorihabitans aurantiacus]
MSRDGVAPGVVARAAGQVALGGLMLAAGTAHLRRTRGYRVVVPRWFPGDPDRVIVASGVVELAIGGALVTVWRQPARAWVGVTTAAFLVAVWPGNVSQYLERRDAGPLLDSDLKRLVRLPLQVPLIAGALAAGDVARVLGGRARDDRARTAVAD